MQAAARQDDHIPTSVVANEVSRRGYKEAHISPFVSTPQSRLTPCQLPGRGAFWGGLPLTKSCPRMRGKWHGEAMTKGERLKAAQLFYCSPQSAYAASSPINGGVFWYSTSTAYSVVPLRGAIVSMGLRGSPGGLRGEIEIFPGPLAKRIIKLLIVLYLTPSVSPTARHLPRQGGFGVHFISFSLVIPRCRADMQANYCLHLIFMIYLKVKLPQGVRHAKAAYC